MPPKDKWGKGHLSVRGNAGRELGDVPWIRVVLGKFKLMLSDYLSVLVEDDEPNRTIDDNV